MSSAGVNFESIFNFDKKTSGKDLQRIGRIIHNQDIYWLEITNQYYASQPALAAKQMYNF